MGTCTQLGVAKQRIYKPQRYSEMVYILMSIVKNGHIIMLGGEGDKHRITANLYNKALETLGRVEQK